MSPDPFTRPEQLSGYSGDLDTSRAKEPGPRIQRHGLDAAANRGKRAPQEGSGVITGSGAGAGGAPDEDFDSGPAGGGGATAIHASRGNDKKENDHGRK